MCNIEKPVVVVFITGQAISREVTVVDPDIGRVLQLDQVLRFRRVMEIQVSKDDIRLFLDTETTVGETYIPQEARR